MIVAALARTVWNSPKLSRAPSAMCCNVFLRAFIALLQARSFHWNWDGANLHVVPQVAAAVFTCSQATSLDTSLAATIPAPTAKLLPLSL